VINTEKSGPDSRLATEDPYIHGKIWGYKVEEKLHLGLSEQNRMNTAGLDNVGSYGPPQPVTGIALPYFHLHIYLLFIYVYLTRFSNCVYGPTVPNNRMTTE
jgi:hypothetical protein